MEYTIFNRNGRLESTYPETSQGADMMFTDIYNKWGAIANSVAKAYGGVNYTVGESGLLNAIYGKELHATMLQSENIIGAFPSRAYGSMGVRLVDKQPTYGRVEAGKYYDALGIYDPSSNPTGRMANEYLGLGAMTDYDGELGPSHNIEAEEVRMPYHDIPFKWDRGLGMKVMSAKDDNASMDDYVRLMSNGFTNELDRTLLRPVSIRQPTDGRGHERSIDSIYRIISSGAEINCTDEDWDYQKINEKPKISPSMVTPFGGEKSDLLKTRGNYTGGTHKRCTHDSNVLDLGGRTLQISDLKQVYRDCQVNWDSRQNKAIFASNIAVDKLASAAMAASVHIGISTVQQSLNGIKTLPGNEIGMQCSSFQGVPIIVSGNINLDADTQCVSNVTVGDVTLADFDHMWMSYITPLTMYNSDNPAVNNGLYERNLMLMRMCTRADKFTCHGRITNIADDNEVNFNPYNPTKYVKVLD